MSLEDKYHMILWTLLGTTLIWISMGHFAVRIAHRNGREIGFKLGHLKGHSEGYEEGHSEGYEAGYSQGYSKGWADNDFDINCSMERGRPVDSSGQLLQDD